MQERRVEPRLLCADLVDVEWKDKAGKTRRTVANLEDISLSGACLQVEAPVPLLTNVLISYPKGQLTGKVKYCLYKEIGYFLGIEFEQDCRWSQQSYSPQHLLDPRRLSTRPATRSPRLEDIGPNSPIN